MEYDEMNYPIPDHLRDQLHHQEKDHRIELTLNADHSVEAMLEAVRILRGCANMKSVCLRANYYHGYITNMAYYHWAEKYGDISINDFRDVPYKDLPCVWDHDFAIDELADFLLHLRFVNEISASAYQTRMNDHVLGFVMDRNIIIETTDSIKGMVGLVGCTPEDILLLDMMG